MANHPQLDRGEAVYLTTRYLRAVQTWRWARHPYPDNHRLCLMNQKSTRELSQEISPTTPLHFFHREFRGGEGGGLFRWPSSLAMSVLRDNFPPKQSQNFLSSLNVPLPSLMCKMKTLLSCLILTQICNTRIHVCHSMFIIFILRHFNFMEKAFFVLCCLDIHSHLHGLIYLKISNHRCLNRSSSLVALENIVCEKDNLFNAHVCFIFYLFIIW